MGLLVVTALCALFWGPQHFARSCLTLCQGFSLLKGKILILGRLWYGKGFRGVGSEVAQKHSQDLTSGRKSIH